MVKETIRSQIFGGCLRDYKSHLAGNYKGYYVVMEPGNRQYIVTVNAYSTSDVGNNALREFLQQHQMTHRQITGQEVSSHYVKLFIAWKGGVKKIPEIMNDGVEPLFAYLTAEGYISGCKECGSMITQADQYEINGGHHFLCGSCVAAIDASLQSNQQKIRGEKSTFVAGLVGAFLGALIGGVLWVLIFKLGYIAGIAGAITGVCAMKGYELLGKHLDKKGVVCSIVIMLLVIYLANRVAWAWDAYDAYKVLDFTFADCYRYLPELLEDNDAVGYYVGNLLIGYLLTLLCSIRSIIQAFRATSYNYRIRRMDS